MPRRSCIRFAPTEEIGGVAGDDESLEVVDDLARWLEGLGDQIDDVVAQRIHLRVKFNSSDSIAEIDDRGTGVLLDDAFGFLNGAEGSDAFGYGNGLVGGGDGVEVLAAAGDAGTVAVPGGVRFVLLLGVGEKFFHVGRNRRSGCAHLFGGRANAGGVEHLEGAKLPVVPGLHRLIDLNEVVGDLGHAIRAIGEQLGEEGPIEGSGFIFARIPVEKLRKAGRRVLHVLRHLDRRKFGPHTGLVVERLPVEDVAQIAPFGVLALLFVEALLRFVAQPLVLEHLVDEGRESNIGALVFDLLCLRGEVLRHMRHHVDANHVAQPKGSCLRPADRSAGQRVDLFDRETLLLHEADRIAHREGADAVRDEVWRVVSMDDRLAQAQVAEVFDRCHIGGIGIRCRDDLEQPHVARRVEEVRAEPVASQLHGHAFDDLVDGQAAGVAGDDGVGAAMLLHLVEQRSLDLHVLGDHFDDPVAAGDQGEIVVEVADGDQTCAVVRVEGRGFGLLQSI